MANPKCGTCRFFQENDLPGSGWCHHPQRKVSSDVKILVRRSELACRDDWSRSLWQPATGEPAADAAARTATSSGPLLPTSPESLRAVLNRDLTGGPAAGEDVLLSEGRIVSVSHEPLEPPSRPFPAGNFDPRTAIFKAREAYREKIRANAKASRQSTAESSAGTVHRAAVERPSDDQAGDRWVDSIGTDSRGDAQADQTEAGGAPESSGSSLVASAASSAGDLVGMDQSVDLSAFWDAEPESEDEEWISDSGVQGEVCAPDLPAPIAGTAQTAESQRSTPATDLPGWFRADLPRVCRACRDFRPGTEGQRGWCANAWAFTHRQLVQEDDVAPCHSAIGDWWVPADDVWLVAADVSAHGRATPLLDRLLGTESGQRRRS